MPIENAPDKGRNQRHARLGTGDGLGETEFKIKLILLLLFNSREEQRQITMNIFLLQLSGGLDALPRGSNFDKNAIFF